MATPVMHSLLWCASEQDLRMAASRVEQGLAAQASRHFISEKEFTHWLFKQPRGAVAPSSVLVAGWREAKPCMATIKAARTGNTRGLRPDRTRPQLVTATPRNLLVNRVTVGAMVIVVNKPEQRERAVEWIHSGECDQHVWMCVVRSLDELHASLLSFFSPSQQARAPMMAQSTESPAQRFPIKPAEPARQPAAAPARGRQDCHPPRCATRVRTPSPEYIWQGASTPVSQRSRRASMASDGSTRASSPAEKTRASSPTEKSCCESEGTQPRSPRSGARGRGRGDAGDAGDCASRARTPSPDYMWQGFKHAGYSAGSWALECAGKPKACSPQPRDPLPKVVMWGFSRAV